MTDYPTPWTLHDPFSLGVYGAEARCYEHAVFDGATQVGQIVVGYPSYTGRTSGLAQYGLVLKVRQAKAYRQPAPKKKDESTYETVTTESYDLDGSLLERTMEKRQVYHNTKGAYIKTRSKGRIFISDSDTMTIRYERRKVKRKVIGRQGEVKEVIVNHLVEPKENS